MSQPNFQLISESLKALANEVPNIQNVPVFAIMEKLETIVSRVDQTSKRNDEISQNISRILTARMYIIFGLQYKKNVNVLFNCLF